MSTKAIITPETQDYDGVSSFSVNKQPVSIEADNNEHKYKNNKKKSHKLQRKNILPQIEMLGRKVQLQQQKECQTKIMRKVQEQRSLNQKYLTCQAKRCPDQTSILVFFC